ncbi:hypothetical protein [Leifsonia sp. 2MCAF36]|uniref:hypothetical protein n=1 Tax=Leifsonia sp. 2MCAF36 TaxID=3232988 RepID=UPI003F9A9E3E
MTRRLPPRMLRRLILSGVLGIALGVTAWYLGMDAAHAVGLGAAAFALAACLSALGEAVDIAWAVPAPELRPGARRDIVQLGWSLGARGGRASPEGVRRLRVVAERALRAHGLELEDRAADDELERVLGEETLALLRRGSGVTPPRTAAVARALARLEALGPADGSAPPSAATTSSEPTAAAPTSGEPASASPATTSSEPTSAAPTSGQPASASPAPTDQEPPRAR